MIKCLKSTGLRTFNLSRTFPTCVNSNSCYINHTLYVNIPHGTAMFFDDESFKWDSLYDSHRAYASVRLMLILSAHVTPGQ